MSSNDLMPLKGRTFTHLQNIFRGATTSPPKIILDYFRHIARPPLPADIEVYEQNKAAVIAGARTLIAGLDYSLAAWDKLPSSVLPSPPDSPDIALFRKKYGQNRLLLKTKWLII